MSVYPGTPTRSCQRCGAPFTNGTGRGGQQQHRRFCSPRCKDNAYNAARRQPQSVVCAICGAERTLLHPGRAGSMCRTCAVTVATAAAADANRRPVLDRFMKFVAPNTDTGCWEWIGTCQSNGYGAFAVAGKTLRAHRWAYEHFVGPIPVGLTIDHLCRNRTCVNPEHMEPVTSAENTRRGVEARR